MKNNFECFLEWAKLNNIKLHEYQKQLIKAYFENKKVIIPRQSGRSSGISLLAKFYKDNL